MTQPIVIAPAGDLDLASVDDFRAAVDQGLERAEGDVIVDLSDVAFIDSSGLGVILHAGEQLRRQQRDLAVVAPRGTAAAVLLTLAGLRRRLTIFDSRSAALRRPA